jgi:hypothetical protein
LDRDALAMRERQPLPRIVLGESSLKSAGTPKLEFLSPVECFDSPVGCAAAFNSKPSGSKPVFT